MSIVQKSAVIAVTGAAGFIGGWIVSQLLEKGYRVKACVRDENDNAKTGFLKSMGAYASGRLTLHTADLDTDGCFDEIFSGCEGVCHVSHVSDYEDQDYVQRVCDHIIASINKSGTVKRVIVTSSIAAVISEVDLQELVKRPICDEDRYPDEQNPKRSVAKGQGYSMGKVIAQRAFSDAAEANGSWDAITCCPADNVGPILSAHQKNMGPWQHNIEMMLLGKYYQNGAYRPWMTVDVRDDAACHIALLESDKVSNGERYIAWSTDMRNVEDICASIARLLPELGFVPSDVIDPFPERIQAREEEFRKVWQGCDLRNEKIKSIFPIEFRSLDDSIRDCAESLLCVAGIEVK